MGEFVREQKLCIAYCFAAQTSSSANLGPALTKNFGTIRVLQAAVAADSQ